MSSSSATTKMVSELTTSNLYESQAKEYLNQKQVTFGEPIMAKRKSPGRPGDVELSTNVYALQLKQQPIKVYRYDVKITGIKQRSGRVVEFTKKFKDDFTQTERRFRCRDVISTFMEQNRNLAVQVGCMYNDLQAIMYTLQPFPQGEKLEYIFDPTQMHHANEFVQHRLGQVILKFTPTKEFAMELLQLEQNLNLMYANRDLAQFLDIATSQEVFFRENQNGESEHVHFSTKTSYLYDPSAFNFTEEDTALFPENKTYLAIGCEKAIHTVQGPQNPAFQENVGISALVVQPKKTPFHDTAPLIDKVTSLLGGSYERIPPHEIVNKLEKNLKGLVVQTTHNPNNIQILTIKGFEKTNAREHEFTMNDNQVVAVADYFQTKYKVELKHWKLPLVITESIRDGVKQKNYFPIEVLYVCDNQRVKVQQQTPAMISQAIRKCAVPPFVLREQVHKAANSLHIWDSTYLRHAQVAVGGSPLCLQGHKLQSPTIGFDSNRTDQPGLDGKWRSPTKYLTSKCPNEILQQYGWAIFAFPGPGERPFQREFEQFVNNYRNQANSMGIVFPEPNRREIIQSRGDKRIEDCFKDASENGLAFLLCFHGDNDDQAHQEIKVNERRYNVATQCIKIGTARNVVIKNQRLTMLNILQKTNVKLGGLNFTLPRSRIATDTTTLIIGFNTNHPAGGLAPFKLEGDPNSDLVTSAPSVVGFSANVGPTKLPFDFIGDFLYQLSRREEKVNLIEDIVTRCLYYFTTVRDGKLPESIILYRDGCSEGQFGMLLKYEIPLLKKAMQEHGCNARLTVIVPNKLQNIRFFNKNINARDKTTQQNLMPGVVADTTVVHPVFAEFFLNSHCALQGTARTPKYTVIYDDCEHPLEVLEQITYDLCYGHQIVFSPLSLPAPVRIAFEYAKRGRNLYNARIDELQVKYQQQVTYSILNQELSFYGHSPDECWLAQYRVNA